MNDEELQARLDEIAEMVGFDEFEKIVVADLVKRIGPPDAPGSPERDRLFIELGALVAEKMERWAFQ